MDQRHTESSALLARGPAHRVTARMFRFVASDHLLPRAPAEIFSPRPTLPSITWRAVWLHRRRVGPLQPSWVHTYASPGVATLRCGIGQPRRLLDHHPPTRNVTSSAIRSHHPRPPHPPPLPAMAPLTAGVHHVGLTVPDLTSALAFFTDVLGYTKVGGYDVRGSLFSFQAGPRGKPPTLL